MKETKIAKLYKDADEIRKITLDMISWLGKGHVGGSMSIIEVLTVLYCDKMKIDPKNPKWEERDRFILSKGHAGPALYAALAYKGYFPMEEIYTLNKPGTRLPSHCDMRLTPGIDQTTGSLAQGASCAVGNAMALKMSGFNDSRVYCMVGDGELQEGQCWEAFMLAGGRKLDNLVFFCDRNHGQVDGLVDDILDVEPLAPKLRAFNFEVYEVDGHDVKAIAEAVDSANNDSRPSFIICHTIKAKGVPGMECNPDTHNMPFTREQYEAAVAYIDAGYQQ